MQKLFIVVSETTLGCREEEAKKRRNALSRRKNSPDIWIATHTMLVDQNYDTCVSASNRHTLMLPQHSRRTREAGTEQGGETYHPAPRRLLCDPCARDGPNHRSKQRGEGVYRDGLPSLVRGPCI